MEAAYHRERNTVHKERRQQKSRLCALFTYSVRSSVQLNVNIVFHLKRNVFVSRKDERGYCIREWHEEIISRWSFRRINNDKCVTCLHIDNLKWIYFLDDVDENNTNTLKETCDVFEINLCKLTSNTNYFKAMWIYLHFKCLYVL